MRALRKQARMTFLAVVFQLSAIIAAWESQSLAQDTVRTAWRVTVPIGASYYAQSAQAEMFTHFDTDGFGNFYASSHASRESNVVIIKYSSVGDLLWSRTHGDFGLVWADVRAMAIDSSGTCVLAGIGSVFPDTGGHGYLLSVDPEGNTNWFRWTGDLNPSGCEFIAQKLLSDDTGNIYYLGSPFENWTCEGFGYATAKFFANGDTAWVRILHIPRRSYDYPHDIAVDKAKNVYVTGSTFGGNLLSNRFDYLVVKYLEDGTMAWTSQLDMSDLGEPFALVIDDEMNVYVTGEITSLIPGQGYGTAKLNCDGDSLWTRYLPAKYRSNRGPKRVVIDSHGDIVICGGGFADGEYGLFTVKYSPAGDTVWTRTEHFNGIPSFAGWDYALTFDLDSNDNVYVTGQSVPQVSIPRSFVIVSVKYDSRGERQWFHFYDATGDNNFSDYPRFITAQHTPDVFVGGISQLPDDQWELGLFKLSQVYRCGDVDGSGEVTVADAVSLVQYLFADGAAPMDLHSGDLNGDGKANITDAVYLIHHVFAGGPALCAASR